MENQTDNVVSLSLAPQAIGELHFHSVEVFSEQLGTIMAAVELGANILRRRDEFGHARAMSEIRDVFAGLAYRLDELGDADGVSVASKEALIEVAAEFGPAILDKVARYGDAEETARVRAVFAALSRLNE